MNRVDLHPDLERLGEALHTSTTIDLAREERATAAVATRTRQARLRPRVLAGSTLGLVGVGAAFVLPWAGPRQPRRPSRSRRATTVCCCT